jgi:hypothetical protein
MHHCQNNLEACAACVTDLGVESLDMSAEYVEFLKRGHREYKVLEVALEAPPKKRASRASKVKATDASGTDASIKVHVHDILLALLLRGGAWLARG